MKKIIGITLVTIIFSVVFSDYCEAIPAFARKYRISCKTCHSPASPSLKDYGDDFAGNGFKLEEYDSPGYFVGAGDDKLSLLRNFPIAARMDGFVTYNNAGDEKSDFGSPYLMKLLSGGALSENLAYYFYFYMSERGEIAGVEDAYLMYDNLFGSELDIMLGQFQVSDPMFKRELRLQLEDYRLYTSEIGISDITLTYDKGVMLSYGFDTGTDIVAEVVNGNGIGEAGDYHIFDKDRYKSYLGRISQNLGEYFRVGGFVYYGKEKQKSDSAANSLTNRVMVYGPDFTLNVNERWKLNGQYTIRTDSEVYPAQNSKAPDIEKNLTTEGILVELTYSPKGDQSDWYLQGMYNRVESDYEDANYESATFHAGYILRRNIRLVGEYTYVTESRIDKDFGRYSLGFVSAF